MTTANSENKPTTITAAEWPTVADAVLHGKCKVYVSRNLERVFDVVERETRDGTEYIVWLTERADEDMWYVAIPEEKLVVHWLDTPPADEPAALIGEYPD